MECEDDEVEGGGEDTHPPNLMSHLLQSLSSAHARALGLSRN